MFIEFDYHTQQWVVVHGGKELSGHDTKAEAEADARERKLVRGVSDESDKQVR